MKKILFLVIAVFIGSTLAAQIKKDAAVLNYIKAKKEFVALTDTSNLPPAIKPYHQAITAYMSQHNMDKNDYYVSANGVGGSWEVLTFQVYHYNGFKLLKEMEDKDRESNKNRRDGDPVIVTDLNGNASGMDGTMAVSRMSGQVIGFSLWQ